MDIFTKEGILLVVQVDHLSGELLGNAIDLFYEVGVKNVNIVPTITKKNRPGHIFLIDTPAEAEARAERVIVDELGASGWHRMSTEHRHVRTETVLRNIEVVLSGTTISERVEGKKICDVSPTVRPENSSCSRLRDTIFKCTGTAIPMQKIVRAVTEALESQETEVCRLNL